MKILSVFGTRPEAIKMAPLVKAFERQPAIDSVVCVTGQHSGMLKQVLGLFQIHTDHDLQVMTPNQSLNALSARLFAALSPVLDEVRPDCVMVHGDTTTSMAAALSAFHHRIPVGHVEAGLRTGDLARPWPEEMNRRAVDLVSDMMFAPTRRSKENLQKEQLGGRIYLTGNTVVDALCMTDRRLRDDAAFCAALDRDFPDFDPDRRLVLVTAHRRESFGAGFADICRALTRIAMRPDVQIVYPVHPNPNVQGPVTAALSRFANVHLIEPVGYFHFVRLMQRAELILTDSGGVQEEAPSLGKPVLVMRDTTERPEAVEAGTVRLVGTDPDTIVDAVDALLDRKDTWHALPVRLNPYGDGLASERIAAVVTGRTMAEFDPVRPLAPAVLDMQTAPAPSSNADPTLAPDRPLIDIGGGIALERA